MQGERPHDSNVHCRGVGPEAKLGGLWRGGKGFFHVSIPEDQMKKPTSNSAMVYVEKGNFSVEGLLDELKELVDDKWDWQVRKLSNTDFMVVFPSKELLRMASRGGGLVLPITEYRAVVSEVSGDPLATEVLEQVWLRLIGVPEPLRVESALKGCMLELGIPLEVDAESLENPAAPIRMRFGCRKPVQLKPSIMVFINFQGYKIVVEREGEESDLGPLPPPPPPPRRKDDEDAAADDSSEGEEDDYGRKRRRKSRSGSADKGGEVMLGEGPHAEQGAAKACDLALQPAMPSVLLEVPLELPKSMFSQYGSNLTPDGNVFKALGAIIQAAKAPALSVVLSEAPPKSALSESVLSSPRETIVGSSPEAAAAMSAHNEVDSARSREWRSKMN